MLADVGTSDSCEMGTQESPTVGLDQTEKWWSSSGCISKLGPRLADGLVVYHERKKGIKADSWVLTLCM